MPKYSKERASIYNYIPVTGSDVEKERILQNNGENLIITGKSKEKKNHRFYYEGYFEGYKRKLIFDITIARDGKVRNPDKVDEYGFSVGKYVIDKFIYNIWKNIERRCYYPKYPYYPQYGGSGIIVNDYFKTYSKFEKWYKQHLYNELNLQIDKDCLGKKEYGPNTCILIPNDINTFLSTLGKGIYTTKYGTYCVRLRRKHKRLNKNFADKDEAIIFKKEEDLMYLNALFLMHPNIPSDVKDKLINYVKVFEYPNWFPRNS